jgi:hypothetical protein
MCTPSNGQFVDGSYQFTGSYSALPIGGSADSGSDDGAIEELQALCASLQKGNRSMARMADSILSKFDSMYMKSPQALHAYAVESLALLRTMENRLDATKHEWLQETMTFSLQSDQLKTKIAATSCTAPTRLERSSIVRLTPLLLVENSHVGSAAQAVPPNTLEAYSPGSVISYLQFRQLENQGVATITAGIANYVQAGINGLVEEAAANVERHGRAICNKNPQIKGNCQVVINFGKNAGDKASAIFSTVVNSSIG